MYRELPIPPHFHSEKVGQIWKVPYQERAEEAERWAKEHQILPSHQDQFKIALLLIDVQNTFCIPGFELFVGGRSGTGAVDDNRRLCEFIYRNLGVITKIFPTMDTHQAIQIFHEIFLIDEEGRHPEPYTLILPEEVGQGHWRFNTSAAEALGIEAGYGQQHLLHYTQKLKQSGKYQLTIWPYHAMLGGIGHALVPAVEEAIFFHSIARISQPDFQIKGNNPLTEHYSALGPEVMEGPDGKSIAQRNLRLIEKLLEFEVIIIAGQAKSHCVAWTVDDLLREIQLRDRGLAERFYLLEDCTSPVVVPGVIDYTEQADEAFKRFADAGMHLVRSVDSIRSWPGIKL